MKVLCSVAAFLLAVSLVFGEECRRHDVRCIDYTVVEKHQDYEERSYPTLVWVSASDNGKNKSEVTRKLIRQLYGYLGGANDQKQKIEMMIPVRTAKIAHDDYNTYIMSIPLLSENSEHPPQPTIPGISVIREPATTYYARSFSGFAKRDEVWDEHAAILKSALANDGQVDTSFYFMSVYDSPWRDTDRLNEVWMIKKEE